MQKTKKSFKLFDVVKSIDYDQMQRMSNDSFDRILHAEDLFENANVGHIHQKMIISLVHLSEPSFRNCFEDYIFADIHKRYNLAFAWIYQEYVYANGYLMNLEINKKKDFTKYDDILCRLLEYLQKYDE